MAFRALRRTVAAIDEQHGASTTTAGDDRGEIPAGTDEAASRRRFLTRAATGGAVAVGATLVPFSSMVPAALAQTGGGTTAGTTAGTTPGTTPGATPAAPAASGDPSLVDGADLEIVVFLQTIELAAVAAYGTIVGTGKLAPATAQTARSFSLHHEEHAKELATLAGGAARGIPNPRLTSELTPLIEGAVNQEELATIAYNLEESITATYAAALGVIDSWQAAAQASRILPVDSQHAVAWSQVLHPDPTEWATQITTWIPNFQSASGAIDITVYAAS